MSLVKANLLKDRELGDLCRSLAVLLHAGVSTADSLFLLGQEESGFNQKLCTELGQRLDRGELFSEALLKAECFPAHFSGMIRIGEQTGRMEETLEHLADFYDERHRVSKFLRSSLAYPSLILLLVLVVVAVLLMEVLPVFDSVYASLGSRLTGLSAGLLHVGQVLKKGLPVLWCLLALLAVAALLICCVPALKTKVKGLLQKLFGDLGILRQFHNARFARALAMGLGSGLPLQEAVKLAEELLSDAPGAAARCKLCEKLLEEGRPLPEAMEQAGLLSAAAGRLLAVGIRGGNSDQVMENIADRMQEEAAETMERTVSRVEPAMVLLTSALVGVILLSVMLPLMNIMSAIG